MALELTATGRYYRVYVNGQSVSQHTTEREAIQKCSEVFEEAQNRDEPKPDVVYRHEYEVRADMSYLQVSSSGTVSQGSGLSASGVTGSFEVDGQITISAQGAEDFGSRSATNIVHISGNDKAGGVGFAVDDPQVGAWYSVAAAHGWDSTQPLFGGASMKLIGSGAFSKNKLRFAQFNEFFISFYLYVNEADVSFGSSFKPCWLLTQDGEGDTDGNGDMVIASKVNSTTSGFACVGNTASQFDQGISWVRGQEWGWLSVWIKDEGAAECTFKRENWAPIVGYKSQDGPDDPGYQWLNRVGGTYIDQINMFAHANSNNDGINQDCFFDHLHVVGGPGSAARVELWNDPTKSLASRVTHLTVGSWSSNQVTGTIRGREPQAGDVIAVYDSTNTLVTTRSVS